MTRKSGNIENHDVVIIGAGVSGMYALHHLREMGLSVRVYDGASDIGGTWWYNRYPGARVDGPGSPFYCYTFSEELMKEWDWEETQSEQSAVLAYLEHVADRFDLRRDIEFETWVQDVRYDEAAQRWTVETSTGARASARFLICAVGALSAANMPDIPGHPRLRGRDLPHRTLAARAGFLRGQAGGRDRHGLLGGAVDPRDRQAGGARDGAPANAQFAFPARNRAITPDDTKEARASWEAVRRRCSPIPGAFPPTPTRARLSRRPPSSARRSTRSCGRTAASSSSPTAMTTSRSARKPTARWPTSCAARSARS